MLNDIVQYVKACDVCQRSKSRKVHVAPPASVFIYRQALGLMYEKDFGLCGWTSTKDRQRQRVILVSKCMYMNLRSSIRCSGYRHKDHGELLVIDGVICRYRLPLCFIPIAKSFVSQLAGAIYKELGSAVKNYIISSTSNGNVEIFNRLLKQTLKLWGE